MPGVDIGRPVAVAESARIRPLLDGCGESNDEGACDKLLWLAEDRRVGPSLDWGAKDASTVAVRRVDADDEGSLVFGVVSAEGCWTTTAGGATAGGASHARGRSS